MPLLLPPRERRRFPRHRTPSVSKGPSSGPSDVPGAGTRLALSTSFHRRLPFLAVLMPLAESPWAPSATTDGACLDLTPLPDFCNHTEGRAHRTNVRSSREAPFLGLRSPGAPEEPRVVSGGLIPTHQAPVPPAEVARASMRAAAAEANSNSSERPFVVGQLASGDGAPE